MYMGDAAVSAERGIDAALAEFAATRWSALLRFGLLLTGNAADAEDLVQTALARTAARWRTMRTLERPEAYVRTAMVRLCANRWRSLLSRERLTGDVPDIAAVADPIEHVADREAMWAALRTLPPRQRAVVVLRYYEDMSEREIARLLGITQGTVKSQASKALRTLRCVLDQADEPPGPADRDIGADVAQSGTDDPRPQAGDPGRSPGAGATAPDLGAEHTPAIGRMQ
jgi:RNA polymerase sigma-70 factor (sigma-E family)